MKRLLREYSFNSDMQYYEMIAESVINGQIEQAKTLFNKMPVDRRKLFVIAALGDWISGINKEHIKMFINLI